MSQTEAGTQPTWNQEYRKGITQIEDLVQLGWIPDQQVPALEKAKELFDIRVPSHYVKQIQAGDLALRKQFVPSCDELVSLPEELEDPIGDERHTPVKGVTHRYPDRVLLKLTYLCGSYCRYCFRRAKVSDGSQNLTEEQFSRALEYLSRHEEIWEVILTGGDPLTLSDARLRLFLEKVTRITHIKVLRFHTRMPTVVPERITDELLTFLKRLPVAVWMVLHVNAASELNSSARGAVQRLANSGISLLSQSVLLKDVNDSVDQLSTLFRGLVELGVKPYYLHYPDLAKGTQAFRIPLTRAIELMKGLRGRFSGMCQPQLVVDIPGGFGKVPVDLHFSRQLGPDYWEFISPTTGQAVAVRYPSL